MVKKYIKTFVMYLSIYFPGSMDKETLDKLGDMGDANLERFLVAACRAILLINAKKKNLPDGFLGRLWRVVTDVEECNGWCAVTPFGYCDDTISEKVDCASVCANQNLVDSAWENTGWTYEELRWIYNRPRDAGWKYHHQGYKKTTEETADYIDYSLELDIELHESITKLFRETGATRFQRISFDKDSGHLQISSKNPKSIYKRE